MYKRRNELPGFNPACLFQLELPLHSSLTFPLGIGADSNVAADTMGLLADVKVEEVDLDSMSEDEEESVQLKRRKLINHREVDAHDIRREFISTLPSEEDGLSQPSLTLQSFARIPSVVSPEANSLFNPEASQDHARAIHEERMPSHDMPGWLVPLLLYFSISKNTFFIVFR